MEIKKVVCYSVIIGWFIPAFTQSSVRVDTFWNAPSFTHTYLEIKIPEGEMHLYASDECGKNLSSLVSRDSTTKLVLDEDGDSKGTMKRKILLEHQNEMRPKSISPLIGSNLTARIANTEVTNATTKAISEFKIDPSISTDLLVELGVGASHLDMSNLSIRNLIVHSALSDVRVKYGKMNKIPMDKLEVHAVRGDIGLKNIELARVELVEVQNDMGETNIVLGEHFDPNVQTNLMVNAGVGDCTFFIHQYHPVKIHLRSGIFSTADISAHFLKIKKGVYVNKAFQDKPGSGTVIICNTDFGKVSVIDHN